MKKIVAFSVLLVLLSAAVFADDGSGWKIGFTAQLSRNFFTAAKASGEFSNEVSTNPTNDYDGKYTGKLGEYIKGSSHLWTWTSENPWNNDTARPDNRLIVSLSNNGDHHSVYIDAKLDNSWISGPSLMGLLNGGAADWSFSGDTGASGAAVVFDGKVGTGRYGGFVPAYEYWNDWINSGDYNFFGVMTQDGYVQSDNISVVNFVGSPWDSVFAVGTTFGGNFRVAVGSTLYRRTPRDPDDSTGASIAPWAGKHQNIMFEYDDTGILQTGKNNPYASASRVRAAFMVSGKNLGPLAFDVFYGINGGDTNTAIRDIVDPIIGVTPPSGKWENLIGVYVGLNVVENLGLSIGGTFNFLKYEMQQIDIADHSGGTVKPSYKPLETVNPTWIGVDIKTNYSGIAKTSISFNNNLSFAGVAGAERKKLDDKIVNNLDYTGHLEAGKTTTDMGGGIFRTVDVKTNTQNWFAWTAVLGVGYSITDNLSLSVGLLNLLSIRTDEKETTTSTTTPGSTAETVYKKTVGTTDELRAAINATYGVGNVTFGLGLVFQWNLTAANVEDKTTQGSYTHSEILKASLGEFKFGVPIFFKVSI
jgi:hypothetical protein